MVKIVKSDGRFFEYEYYCPGCKQSHGFRTVLLEDPGDLSEKERKWFVNKWKWNYDFHNPTISPSLHLEGRCHSFIEAGKIRFLTDCSHELAGQTVDLPDFPL